MNSVNPVSDLSHLYNICKYYIEHIVSVYYECSERVSEQNKVIKHYYFYPLC